MLGPESQSDRELEAALAELHAAAAELHAGDAMAIKALYSPRPDAMLLGALGGCLRGPDEIRPRYDSTARLFRDGRVTHEHLAADRSGDLAYVVSIERHEGHLVGHDAPVRYAYRVTHILRREDGQWRIAHRHADPLVHLQEPDSLVRPFLPPED